MNFKKLTLGLPLWLVLGFICAIFFVLFVPYLWRYLPEPIQIFWLIPDLLTENFTGCYVMSSNTSGCSTSLYFLSTRVIYLIFGFGLGALIGGIITKVKK